MKTAKVENELDINYAVENTNNQIKENKIAVIIKKCNSTWWNLISTSMAIVEAKDQFSNLYIFLKKK